MRYRLACTHTEGLSSPENLRDAGGERLPGIVLRDEYRIAAYYAVYWREDNFLFIVACADDGLGFRDEIHEAGIVGGLGHLGAEEGRTDTSLFAVSDEEHGVDGQMSTTHPGNDYTVGAHHPKELGGVASAQLFFGQFLRAGRDKEDAQEIQVFTMPLVEVAKEGVVLVVIYGGPDSTRRVEGAVYCAVHEFVGV